MNSLISVLTHSSLNWWSVPRINETGSLSWAMHVQHSRPVCLPATNIVFDPHAVQHTAHISIRISPGWHPSSENWMWSCLDGFTTCYFNIMLCSKVDHTIYVASWPCCSTQPVSLMRQAHSYIICTDTAVLWKSFSCMCLVIKYTYQLYTNSPVRTHLWQLAYPANNATLRQTTPTAKPHNSFSNQYWRPKQPSIHSCT
jgi:hypothetical protein